MRLQGRVAWITGAAQGLGEALAHRFAQEGCTGLALSDIQTEKLDAVARAVHQHHPSCAAYALPCDVRNEAEVGQTAQRIAELFGRL
ncbi:MAG: SDR family NAD(P)-dependent oxidoreductase, partial [Fimbriimonadales bacterium]|nr:SDR family NAD(P)-dependent oxidoreductase [Fimbriimonadales bacterium]